MFYFLLLNHPGSFFLQFSYLVFCIFIFNLFHESNSFGKMSYDDLRKAYFY
jgi:hypothetical protein